MDGGNKRGFNFSPASIAVNITTALVIIIVCALAFDFAARNAPSAESTSAPVKVTSDKEKNTKKTKEEPSSPAEKTTEAETTINAVEIPLDFPEYSEDFFSSDLFTGDAIISGFEAYAKLPSENIFADAYYNHGNVLTSTVDDTGKYLWDYAAEKKPAIIYFMLGLNSVSTMSNEEMTAAASEVVDKFRESSPESKVVLLSMTPISESNTLVDAGVDNKRIQSYNKDLQALAKEKGCSYLDLYPLLAENGTLKDDYDAGTGYSISGKGYSDILGYIQAAVKAGAI